MSCILNIETSTNVCSVALSQDGVCLYEDVNMEGPSHAQVLAGYVKMRYHLPTAMLFQSMPLPLAKDLGHILDCA